MKLLTTDSLVKDCQHFSDTIYEYFIKGNNRRVVYNRYNSNLILDFIEVADDLIAKMKEMDRAKPYTERLKLAIDNLTVVRNGILTMEPNQEIVVANEVFPYYVERWVGAIENN